MGAHLLVLGEIQELKKQLEMAAEIQTEEEMLQRNRHKAILGDGTRGGGGRADR